MSNKENTEMRTSKINKSELFTNAWNYINANNWTLSAALKVAWKEAKEGTSNDMVSLESLTGTSFYNAYLSNGHVLTAYQFNGNFILLDETGMNVHMDISNAAWADYKKEAAQKNLSGIKELFRTEGHAIEFKA